MKQSKSKVKFNAYNILLDISLWEIIGDMSNPVSSKSLFLAYILLKPKDTNHSQKKIKYISTTSVARISLLVVILCDNKIYHTLRDL